MNFNLSDDHTLLIEAIEATMRPFDDAYWLVRDRDGEFPEAFYRAFADGGWLGIALPEEFGGAGLGATEAALMMTTIAKSGGAMAAASSIHMNIFGPASIAAFASHEQQQRWLPDIIGGAYKMCFGITEPGAGLDTTRIVTTAKRQDDHYIVRGQKIWTSTAQIARKIMLLARTSPRDDNNPTTGLSLFFTDLDRDRTVIREIDKMGRKAVDSNEIHFDDMRVPREDLIGEEGRGFRYLLHSLNQERILLAAEAIGIGRDALARAARYARERIVFERPIGQNQSIQHPLAVNWAELEAAWLTTMKAASLCDAGKQFGLEANTAKYLAAEAGFKACKQAMVTLGGMGYAREFHVERLMREIMIPYLAPVSQQMILNYIAEKALDLPKSY